MFLPSMSEIAIREQDRPRQDEMEKDNNWDYRDEILYKILLNSVYEWQMRTGYIGH